MLMFYCQRSLVLMFYCHRSLVLMLSCFLQQKKTEDEKNKIKNGEMGSGRVIPIKQVRTLYCTLLLPWLP